MQLLRKTHYSIFYQIYLLICLMLLALIPLWWLSFNDYLKDMNNVNLEIEENLRQEQLKNLVNDLPRHQSIMYRLVSQNKKNSSDIQSLSQTIDQHFNQILATPLSDHTDSEDSQLVRDHTRQLVRQWQEVRQSVGKISEQEIDPLYKNLIQQVHHTFLYFGNSDRLVSDNLSAYRLTQAALKNLPHLQSLIYKVSFYLSEQMKGQSFNFAEARDLYAEVQFIDYHLYELKSQMMKAISILNKTNYKLEPQLTTSFQLYQELIDQLTTTIKNQISNKPSDAFEEKILDLGQKAIHSGNQLWQQINEEVGKILTQQKQEIQMRFWIASILSSVAAISAMIVAYHLCQRLSKKIKEIQLAMQAMMNGQNEILLAEDEAGELGLLSKSFNQMSTQLLPILVHFRQLNEGIQKISQGQLNVRLQKINDNEFDQAVDTFNKMAENFEQVIQRLQQLGLILASSAGQIASSSKEQETIIIEQNATTREIAIAANEISFTAKELARTMGEVNVGAEQTSQLASVGKNSLTKMEGIMKQMVDASTNIASKLTVLNDRAANIATVITTISKVSDQTNLLSLNASIEAEKAGEYGKSFAVIAREIRRLADQTALATLDIEKIVNEMMSAVTSSVMGVDDFTQEIHKSVHEVQIASEQLATIIEQVQNFTTSVETVNQGMQTQSTGAEQINESITQLSLTSEQTTKSLHRFYHTIQELNAAANELKELAPILKKTTIK